VDPEGCDAFWGVFTVFFRDLPRTNGSGPSDCVLIAGRCTCELRPSLREKRLLRDAERAGQHTISSAYSVGPTPTDECLLDPAEERKSEILRGLTEERPRLHKPYLPPSPTT
jgi:hypothetical protein